MTGHQPKTRKSREDRTPMTIRERLAAGFGLTLALLSAGVDGYLTADQMRPVWQWLCHHFPHGFHTGWLAGLAAHWPASRLAWPDWQWIGAGLVLALVGKGALLPIQYRAARLGRRAVLGLNLFIVTASLFGGLIVFQR
ncbi:hypothetical protein [Asaia bogorensis]|uniref:Uncharacterized protein n=2 Tax=Asaia TaxID=91914 RepID=A0A060QDE0_9PROT|nr:hypothetical protein [Asaia bogorensis]CDG38955.1 hypothetical protein ASAP_0910 [Asaia bogorensis]